MSRTRGVRRVSVLVEERSRISALSPAGSTPRHDALRAVAAADTGSETMALVVTEGESLGRRIAIDLAPIVIGRGVGVDLQVKDPTVSRHHCVIWRAAGRCWVRDLGSTNRTRVNNRCSLVTEIFDGDVLAVGQTVLTLAVARRFDESGAVRA
jgi:pSer/pThr/pTyr-binding forkhead associated (FHA) protein